MSKKTRLSSIDILERAKNFFQKKNGLKVIDETANCCVEFASNLGFVIVQSADEGQNREVTVTTIEYEYQIQEFLKRI